MQYYEPVSDCIFLKVGLERITIKKHVQLILLCQGLEHFKK